LKETGFGEGNEHEIHWREGTLPDEVVEETVSDATVVETPACRGCSITRLYSTSINHMRSV